MGSGILFADHKVDRDASVGLGASAVQLFISVTCHLSGSGGSLGRQLCGHGSGSCALWVLKYRPGDVLHGRRRPPAGRAVWARDRRARAAETAGPGRSSLLPIEWNRGVPSQAQLCVGMGAVAVGGALLAA